MIIYKNYTRVKYGNGLFNTILNKLPLPEMHLSHPSGEQVPGGSFNHKKTYSYAGPFTKYEQRVREGYLGVNDLDKAAKLHDQAYTMYSDTQTRNIADNILASTANVIANTTNDPKEAKDARFVEGVMSLKSRFGFGLKQDNEILADELHHPIRHKYPRRKVLVYKANEIWACDLVDMTAVNADDGYRYILNVVDCFSKYAWSIPLKSKKAEELISAFATLFKTHKPEKLWWDEETGIWGNKFKTFLANENVSLYATGSEIGVSVVERFNRTLKTWMWKEFTKNNNKKWIELLPTLIQKYNSKIHKTIGMTPIEAIKDKNSNLVDEKLNTDERKFKRPKFKIGDRVRIYEWKQEVGKKGYTPNWTKEIFVISDVLKTKPPTYYIKDLKGEYIVIPGQKQPSGFYEQQLLKTEF